MKKSLILICVVNLAICAGCASIVSKSQYPVTIKSNPSGATVTVTDKRGGEIHQATTPATISLASGAGFFSPARYSFEFQKEGYLPGSASLYAGMDGWYIGNLIFGGLLGILIVDPATGAMWRLDDTVFGNLSPNPSYTTSQPADERPSSTRVPVNTKDSSQSVSDQLKQLKELKDLGVLTEEEYETKRKALIEKL